MANAYQVKADVVNELRNRLYYNQLEVQRLLNNPAGISHKEIVDTVIMYLKLNVEATQSIELLEAYIPTPPQQQPVQPAAQPQAAPAPEATDDDGIKKID